MKEIPLTQGKVTLVDDEDYEKVGVLKWYAAKFGKSFYAVRRLKGTHKTLYLSRFLLDAPDNMDTDHINGDTLDNRKCNIRIVTTRENTQNRHGERSSIYPGVSYAGKNLRKPWRAKIVVSGKSKHIGYYPTEIEAYGAYLKECKEL
jgi:hypothetical protein